MCRLFGMSAGDRRAKATFWLLGAPDSIALQSHREPDGTGLGWFNERGVPQVRKQAIAAYEDTAFAREAREVSSSTFVAHVRFASTGGLDPRNTHPFEQQERLFAHNGVVEDLPALEARLRPQTRALVHGDTDSERLFALITQETEDHDGDLAEGIRAACEWVAQSLPLLAINFVIASAHGLWALRYPEVHELHVLERQPGSRLEHSSSFGTRICSEQGATQPFVVIASERLDADPGWRALESGELVHVDPTLRVNSSRILAQPPLHPLTLAELDERARLSQSGG